MPPTAASSCRRLDNKNINPDGGDDCFAVSVLKALFLVKYVKEFPESHCHQPDDAAHLPTWTRIALP